MVLIVGCLSVGSVRAFWLCLSLLAWSTAVSAQSLVEVYDLARRYDKDSTQLDSRKALLDARHSLSLGSYYPKLSMEADFGKYSRVELPEGEVPAANSRTFTVEAILQLYKPGRAQAVAQSRLAQEGLVYEAKALQQALMFKYAEAYLGCTSASYVVQAAAAQMLSLSAQLESIQRSYGSGAATVIDLREAQSRYQTAIAQHEAASSELAVRQEALKAPLRLVDIRLPVLEIEAFDANQTLDWLASVSEASLETNPAIVAARINVDVAKLEISKERSAYFPQVDFGVSHIYTHDGRYTELGQSPSSQSELHLVITIPLFDGFSTSARTSEAAARYRLAEGEFEDAKLRQYETFTQARVKLASAIRQLKAYGESERSARAAVQANKFGYESGVRLSSDVLNSEAYLFQVRREVSRVQYDAIVAYLSMRRAAGVLSTDDLEAIDKGFLKHG